MRIIVENYFSKDAYTYNESRNGFYMEAHKNEPLKLYGKRVALEQSDDLMDYIKNKRANKESIFIMDHGDIKEFKYSNDHGGSYVYNDLDYDFPCSMAGVRNDIKEEYASKFYECNPQLKFEFVGDDEPQRPIEVVSKEINGNLWKETSQVLEDLKQLNSMIK